MQYRNLGRTGLKVSQLCLGTMQFGWTVNASDSHAVLTAALAAGINFIDTADIYSRWAAGNPGGVSETIIGNWLHSSGVDRTQVVLATKLRGEMHAGPLGQGLSRKRVMAACDASLRRLQTDYIDLYQTHSPDAETPEAETLGALTDLVRAGKVRYLGCSNYKAWQLMGALWASDKLGLARYDCLQPHYSLVNRAEYERELAVVCSTHGVGVIPYSPLGGGFLTGKYKRTGKQPESARASGVQKYFTERNWALLAQLEQTGKAHGKSVSQVALAWQLARPEITAPIIGARDAAQLADNLGACELQLNADELQQLNDLSSWT